MISFFELLAYRVYIKIFMSNIVAEVARGVADGIERNILVGLEIFDVCFGYESPNWGESKMERRTDLYRIILF